MVESKNNSGSAGFGVVSVLVLVLAVLAIAAAGYIVLKHNQTKKSVADTSTTSTSSQQANEPATTDSNAQTAQHTLEITQWGVEFPYSGSDTFTYSLNASSPNIVSIASKALASEDQGCTTKGAGEIARYAPTDAASGDVNSPTVAEDAQANPGKYSYVDGYYYQFYHSQSACGSSVSASDENQANATVSAGVAKIQPAAAGTAQTSN